MPINDILFLVGIVFAFVAFAAALAWGDHQTRLVSRPKKEAAHAIKPGGHTSLVLVETTGQHDRVNELGSTCNVSGVDKVTIQAPSRTQQTM
jgi:hypothetical protein